MRRGIGAQGVQYPRYVMRMASLGFGISSQLGVWWNGVHASGTGTNMWGSGTLGGGTLSFLTGAEGARAELANPSSDGLVMITTSLVSPFPSVDENEPRRPVMAEFEGEVSVSAAVAGASLFFGVSSTQGAIRLPSGQEWFGFYCLPSVSPNWIALAYRTSTGPSASYDTGVSILSGRNHMRIERISGPERIGNLYFNGVKVLTVSGANLPGRAINLSALTPICSLGTSLATTVTVRKTIIGVAERW
jgi:hypothetical protein